MDNLPRVLIISHNVLSREGAMGKTMASMLSCIPPEKLAQLYFRKDVPSLCMCQRYCQISDQEALRAVFSRNCNPVFYEIKSKDSIREKAEESEVIKKIYRYGRKRTPLAYFARNLIWKLSGWDVQALWEWLDDFRPEVIFFASGDYSFAYQITAIISDRYKVPIVLWCCDDYYLTNRHVKSWLGKLWHLDLQKWRKRISERTESIIVISNKMKEDYQALFSQPIYTMRIAAIPPAICKNSNERHGIVYAGGLGVNRLDPLVELGRELKAANLSGLEAINVYTNEDDNSILSQLTEENGIRFKGSLPAEKMSEVLGYTKFLLHIEAFDEDSKERTRYSLSTKIGESLCSGACLIAYGPSDIASIEYLARNRAAVVLEDAAELPQVLVQLESDLNEYRAYVIRAGELATECHNQVLNDLQMQKILVAAAEEWSEKKRREEEGKKICNERA